MASRSFYSLCPRASARRTIVPQFNSSTTTYGTLDLQPRKCAHIGLNQQTQILTPLRYASTSSPKEKSPLPPPKQQAQPTSTASSIAQTLRSTASRATATYVAYGATQRLFEVCSAQADYKIPQLQEKGAEVLKTPAGEDIGVGEGWWYKELGLLPTFSSWSQVTFLHMYLLTVRLRDLPSNDNFLTYSRHLLDHFSHNAEHRMTVFHDISMRGVRNKYLKDLFLQWRGIIAAYDEGMVSGDAVLGAAIWRNLFKASATDANGEEIDWEKVACIVAYMRRALTDLSRVPEADLLSAIGGGPLGNKGGGIFGPKPADRSLAAARSSLMAEKV
ncbi:hypothetical protein AJ80_04602 [Polytolypa hystricis UAMH7299]|uniref:Ubiquinol-cytochrome c chaperone domain-containing protein n=1 Tax=Polytolypa hystricis (strain UAMH7299) TaxID=1447883 RepID=A0A2B7YAA0_POLH7|nr:hypothetical protein AJ80_04602 [Polytolypa hystricis UAMH7299]